MGVDSIAIMIPCYNEEKTIYDVVSGFKRQIPHAVIYVYDNNSTDDSRARAKEAGAVVAQEHQQGKGNVVRTMFEQIDADIYVLVDGDKTYPDDSIHDLVDAVKNHGIDMAIGDRLSNGAYERENKRPFHNLGNIVVRGIINSLFSVQLRDIMSGYRAFSRRFVKNFPVLSTGFEIETEMTLHALEGQFKIQEFPICYMDRPMGSESKLSTFKDGIKVIGTIISIFKDYRPLRFFGFCSMLVGIIGCMIGSPVLAEYYTTHYIAHIPLAILAAAVEIMALLLLVCGIILEEIVKINRRNFQLRLLDYDNNTRDRY